MTGRLIHWLSAKPGQNEALFKAGTTFRVLGVQREGDRMTIDLDETGKRKRKSKLSVDIDDMTDAELLAEMRRSRAQLRFTDDPNEYDQDFADRMQSGGIGVPVED